MVSLSLDPPPYTREGRKPRRGRRFVLTIASLLLVSAGFVAGRWTAPGGRMPITVSRGGAAPAPSSAPAAAPDAAQQALAPGQAAPAAAAPAPGPAGAGQPAPAALAPAAPAPAPPAAALPPGPRRIVVTLAGPLENAIAAAVPPSDRGIADQLTQVVNRLLVWDLRVSRDGRRGDTLQIVYSPPGTLGISELGANEPLVEAVRYDSQKLSAIIAAYRWQPPGARWARYFRADGTEVEERLTDTPIAEYEQVTSLLRDGRRHKGVDFRVPVGTPVFATFDGVIERRNWNFAGNGNCLDVRDPATGRHAIYLHLDVLPKDMVPGRRVKKGEQIASSGNSGRSFGPHLHYQLESASGQVLDPFEIHPVERVKLDAAQRAAFELERARLDGALTGHAVARAGAPPPPPPPPPPAAQ
ncbi:MAG TPA: M23 family metallopeptidase [Anaeromyxobacter sp.]|nr:M23 family metallopeptidase [Anaeromyxobacter sp.]